MGLDTGLQVSYGVVRRVLGGAPSAGVSPVRSIPTPAGRLSCPYFLLRDNNKGGMDEALPAAGWFPNVHLPPCIDNPHR